MRSLPLALTMGEPAGIGPELTLRAWAARDPAGLPPFFAIADPDHLRVFASKLGIATPLTVIALPREAEGVFHSALPVLPCPLAAPVAPGVVNVENGPAVIRSIELAVDFVLAGETAAVVTNPIHKKSLWDSGFRHPGHTEFLGVLAKRQAEAQVTPVMMLTVPGLRVVPITIHAPLKDVAAILTTQSIVDKGLVAAAALTTDFGIATPRLAVAALNPHAGEGGTLGTEEASIIAPAIAALRQAGVSADGPFPADSLFHEEALATFDAVLCMYHDQALIPLKARNFYEGVNITLGLPFIRTSPDHGTAFDIAGQGVARPDSLIAAIKLAAQAADSRRRHA